MRYTMSNGAEVTTRAMSEDDGAHREVMLSGEVIGWLYGERESVWYGETRNGEPIMAATSYGVAREVYRHWTGNDVKVTRVDDDDTIDRACAPCEVCGRPATDSVCDVNGMPDGVQVWVEVCDDDACRNAITDHDDDDDDTARRANRVVMDNLEVCVDCAMWHANRDDSGSERSGAELMAAYLETWDGWVDVTTGWMPAVVIGDDAGFSYSACDVCGNRLGGDRFHATLID